MPIVENTMKTKLESGECVFSFNIVISRTPAIAGIVKECGFDWLFIDTEHNTMDLDTVSTICIAALPVGITPIVRVPGPESFHATRVLDGGAQGVIVPHIDTANEAQSVVENCKFPDIGHRSVTSAAPQLGYETIPSADAITALNKTTFIIVMLETPKAIENVEEIAAVPGIDCILIGTNDLCATSGIPGQLGHDRIIKAYDKVITACNNAGKYPGMGGVYDNELTEKYLRMGIRVAQAGGDTALLMKAGKERVNFLNSLDLNEKPNEQSQ